MERLGIGYCKNGYDAGWDEKGLDSQEACNLVCLSEKRCKFAAWYPKKTCSRYNGEICDLETNDDFHKSYSTFEKKSSGIL